MKMIIPKPLKLEHKELHKKLIEAVKTSGPIGKAAEMRHLRTCNNFSVHALPFVVNIPLFCLNRC